MPEKRPKLLCPKCGATMNHHAEKIVFPLDPREAARADPAFGGLVEEFHSCPNCGNSETREATGSFHA